MEKIIERLEGIIERQLKTFEEKPVTTSLKFLLFYYIFKKVYEMVKGA